MQTTVIITADKPEDQLVPISVAPVRKRKSEKEARKTKQDEEKAYSLPGTASDQESSSHDEEEEEEEIQFCGINWQNGHRQIPTDVINTITAMSPPTNKKETQAFLGAVGFWRVDVRSYSLIVSPLYHVTQKKNDFKWGPEQQQAFEQIEQERVHAVALGPIQTGTDVKKCALRCSRGEWSHLEPLAESSTGDLRSTP
ncbi:hypothetical protein AAES_123329 [Amazona aestiva]|uniref:Reverse transcriptase/retrotransposon-derived protein RNase H-like domain-containing protein n=1 Tax=Amazona aestiva TaxID=12930 RepID=A0A0Q3M4X8_AMAAE|nr:hypothetical protein AAES_123329 [Amazona aestiva]